MTCGHRRPFEHLQDVSVQFQRGHHHQALASGVHSEDAAGIRGRESERMGRDGVEDSREIERRADGPAHISHRANFLERAFQRHTPLLELNGPPADAVLQGAVQLLQLAQSLGPVVHGHLQRPRHLVEGSRELPDLVSRLDCDLLLQMPRGDLLRLLRQLLHRLRDAPGETVDGQGADDEEGHGDTAPELCQSAHLLLDARQRKPQPDPSDDLLFGRPAPGPGTGADQQLIRSLRLFRDDGRHELDESLAATFDLSR